MGRPNVNWIVGIALDKQSTYTSKTIKVGIPFASQVTEPNIKYIIKYDFNLGGESVEIPENCILEFDGGSISNGTITGTDTQLYAPKTEIFRGITISGTWNAPEITTAWFDDVTDVDDVIKQVFNLCSNDHYNAITVESGDYWVTIPSNDSSAISLTSHTSLILLGNIRTRGHGFYNNAVTCKIQEKTDIRISGGGYIYGDKQFHDFSYLDSSHETDHVLLIARSTDIIIDGINIRDATGDGIDIWHYGLDVSGRIIIRNFTIENTRRMGITLGGCNVIVENGTIKTARGTLPEAGIDIEITNNNDFHRNSRSVIQNLKIDDCYRGILITNTTTYENNYIIDVKNVEANVGRGILATRYASNIHVSNCVFNCTPEKHPSTFPAPSTNIYYELNYMMGRNCVLDNCKLTMVGEPPAWAEEEYIMLLLRKNDEDGQSNVINSVFDCPYANACQIAYKTKFIGNKVTAKRFAYDGDSQFAIIADNNLILEELTLSSSTFTGNRILVKNPIRVYNTTFTNNVVEFEDINNVVFNDESYLFYLSGNDLISDNIIQPDNNSATTYVFYQPQSSNRNTIINDNWFNKNYLATYLVGGEGEKNICAMNNIHKTSVIDPAPMSNHPVKGALSSNRTLNSGVLVFPSRTTKSYAPLSDSADTGTSKTITSQVFSLYGNILYYNGSTVTTTTSAQSLDATKLWLRDAIVDIRKSVNLSGNLTVGEYVYIKGAKDLSDNTLVKFNTVDTCCTQTLPSTADNCYYIRLGRAIDTHNVMLEEDHPVYRYNNGVLELYEVIPS